MKTHTLAVLAALVLVPAGAALAQSEKNIVTTAAEAGSFQTLIAAVEAAGLEDALKGEGPLTVFAPTDAAFGKLPEGTLESLLEDPEALRSILTYHVVAGEMKASDVVGRNHLETLNGKMVPVETRGGSVKIGGAGVVQTDVDAGNGIIHVIDTVMIPPAE